MSAFSGTNIRKAFSTGLFQDILNGRFNIIPEYLIQGRVPKCLACFRFKSMVIYVVWNKYFLFVSSTTCFYVSRLYFGLATLIFKQRLPLVMVYVR